MEAVAFTEVAAASTAAAVFPAWAASMVVERAVLAAAWDIAWAASEPAASVVALGLTWAGPAEQVAVGSAAPVAWVESAAPAALAVRAALEVVASAELAAVAACPDWAGPEGSEEIASRTLRAAS